MAKSFRALNKALPAIEKLAAAQVRLANQSRNTTRSINQETRAIQGNTAAAARNARAKSGIRTGPVQGPPGLGGFQPVQGPQIPFKELPMKGLKAGVSGFKALKGAMKGIPALGTAIAAAFSVKQLVTFANDAQFVANRLKVVLADGEPVAPLFAKIRDVAIETRTPLRETAQMYQRLRLASKNLNVSNEQAMKTTELFGKLLTIQGATAHEARSALTQFTQAIQSGKLAGDEFRSISENLPAILNLIAEETGKPIEQLKALAEQGRLTPDLLIRAMLRAENQIRADFEKTGVTISQGMEQLKTRVTSMVGEFLRSERGSELLAKSFAFLNKLLDGLVIGFKMAGTVIKILVAPFKILFNIVAKTAEIINTFRSDVDELAIAEERLAQTQKMIADGKFPMGVEAANHQLREQALTVIELRKAQEEQKKTQEELNEVNNAAIDRIRGLNGQFKKFSKEVTVDLLDFKEDFMDTVFRTLAIDFPQGVGDAFAETIMEGKSMKEQMKSLFKDMAKQVIAQITRMIVQMILMRTIMASLGMTSPTLMQGGGIGGFFSGLGDMVSGTFGKIGKVFGFANGGNPPVGVPSIVGERGPELFVPRAAGTVIPNEALGGSTIVVERLEIMPGASIDQALTEKPMSYWVDLTQEKILPALNTLGQAGNTTTLSFRGNR
jgi:tape measure domain-containing protein|tara:strand:+ start:2441 stop:4444 length:2004 start_codon:yes stop_codon:yes gene_type:complete